MVCLVLLTGLATAAVYKKAPINKNGMQYTNMWSWKNIFKISGGITGAAVANFEPKPNPTPQYRYVETTKQNGKYYNSITGFSVLEQPTVGQGKYYTTTPGKDGANWRKTGLRCDYFGCK